MRIYGSDIEGIEGRLIRFKAVKEDEKRGVTLLGLAQKVVREGYVRAVKAIETLEGDWSQTLGESGYTIQLNPAETLKTSSGLDLPIAIMLLNTSILKSLESIPRQIEEIEDQLNKIRDESQKQKLKEEILSKIEALNENYESFLKYRSRLVDNKNKYLMIGTLDIESGEIMTPEFGMFGMICSAGKGFTVIIPEDSEVHGSVIAKARDDIKVYKAKDLQEVWNIVLGTTRPRKVKFNPSSIRRKRISRYVPDLKAIVGAALAKKAMIVALAGGHNILLVGPSGEGKTMLSQAAIKLLPEISHSEMFEINKVYSAKGELRGNEVLLERPFQEVSNVTQAGLFGGGKPPVPGIVSLAHNGILFIDEINLLPNNLIEHLRSALNNRVQKVQRLYGTIEYPCNFIMVSAMNPCRCGLFGHFVCPVCNKIYFTAKSKCTHHPNAPLRNMCRCTKTEIVRFRDKLSQPILGRIDLKVFLSPYDNIGIDPITYASSTIKRTIENARDIQKKRYENEHFGHCNAWIPDRSEFERCTPALDQIVQEYFKEIFNKLTLPKRQEVKLLLVSRTIADLEGVKNIRKKDVNIAIQLMGLTHPYFSGLV